MSVGRALALPASSQPASPTSTLPHHARPGRPHHGLAGVRFFERMLALEKQGQYAAMLRASLGWERANPRDPDGYVQAGRAYLCLGNVKAGIRSGEKALQLNPLYGSDPRIVTDWLNEAKAIDKHFPNLHLQPVVVAGSRADPLMATLQERAYTLLKAKRYDEIERIAARLLASRAQLPNGDGDWQYTIFCKALWEVNGYGPQAEAAWKAQLSQIQAWHRARPRSRLALIALARAWTEGVWTARGDGYANTITPEGQRKMDQRLRQAYTFYAQTQPDLTKSPLVFSGLQSFALLGGIKRAPYEKLWRRASAAFPGYTAFYLSKAQYLMPRWYGQPREWEKFAAHSADDLGGTRGDILYARIVSDQWYYYGQSFWYENSASWPRAQRGFQALLHRGTDPIPTATEAFNLALTKGDFNFAQHLAIGPLNHYVSNYYSARRFTRIRIYVLKQP